MAPRSDRGPVIGGDDARVGGSETAADTTSAPAVTAGAPPPAPPPPVPETPAGSAPPVVYVVAPGHVVHCRRGAAAEGVVLEPRDVGGTEDHAKLIASGALVAK